MLGIILGILTFILILVSLFLVLVILAQKSADAGMGAAFGGGAAESAFGAQTNTVLTKATIYSAILFFVLALVIYLGRVYERTHAREAAGNALPTIAAPATPVLPTPSAATPATAPAKAPATATPSASAPTASTAPSTATPVKQ